MLWHRTGPRTRAGGGALALALLVLSALPFFEGRALELTWRPIPAPWRQAARGLDSQLPANSRALVLPGQAFAFYNWGGTVDPLLPALTRRPVAVRNTPPYDDLHAVDFLWTVDDLVQQQRLIPGQLPPLLDLMSARAVITATDDDRAVSGAMPAAAAAATLAAQPGFGRPSRTYGPTKLFAPIHPPPIRRPSCPRSGDTTRRRADWSGSSRPPGRRCSTGPRRGSPMRPRSARCPGRPRPCTRVTSGPRRSVKTPPRAPTC